MGNTPPLPLMLCTILRIVLVALAASAVAVRREAAPWAALPTAPHRCPGRTSGRARFVVEALGVTLALGIKSGCLTRVSLEVLDCHALAAAVLGAVHLRQRVAVLHVCRVLLPRHTTVL